jgi:hypothetical protein
MRDPWIFWVGVAMLPMAGVSFWFAVHVTSDHLQARLEVVTQLIGGTAGILMGYESAFRTAAKSIWELKENYATGAFFLIAGVLALADVVAKAFDK